MGFQNRTESLFPSQGRFASLGGFPRIFTACCTQFPPPPDHPKLPASPMEQFAALLLVFLLFSAWVLMLLPDKWRHRVIEIACPFCKKPRNP